MRRFQPLLYSFPAFFPSVCICFFPHLLNFDLLCLHLQLNQTKVIFQVTVVSKDNPMPSFPLSFSHLSFDSFPRLDPPPPSGKKRIPRALKTTQDMMISSDPVVSSPDPVVSSPDHTDPPSFSAPDKTLPKAKEELKEDEEVLQDAEKKELQEDEVQENAADQREENGRKIAESEKVDGTTEGGDGGSEEGEEKHQLQLSVPDLINKELPQLEPRDKSSEVWVKVSDSRLASTPCSGKTPCRISLGEEVLLGNGAPCSKGNGVSPDESEPHPDLLSFE